MPAALGDKAQFTRKRAADEPTEDDMAVAMRAAVKKARGAAAPKTPTPPAKAAPKAVPAGKPQSKPAAMPKKGGGGKRTEEQLDLHLERLGVGSVTAQGDLHLDLKKRGKIFLAGFPMRQTVHKFPATALQICCFPNGPESREGVTLPGAQLMPRARSNGYLSRIKRGS